MQIVALFFGSLFLLMSIGIPVALVLFICGFIVMLALGYFDPMSLSLNLLQGINSFPLMAIPFFIFSGELMTHGGLSKRIVGFAKLVVGRIRGGLGYATVLASIIFAGLSGSGIADAAAIGGILIPLMVQNNYRKDRATALISASGILAPIIPPSTPFILMATICNLSITKLFMGGLVPGLIIGTGLMIMWGFVVRKDGYQDVETFTLKQSVAIMLESLPALFFPVIIVGGIRFGLFTPTEAGAFAVVYALIICKFYYKELTLAKMIIAMKNTVSTTATVILVVGCATTAGYYLTMAQIPAKLAEYLNTVVDQPMLLMLLVNLFLLVMGMLLDITPNILIFSPILLPIGIRAGFDPYYFAFIMGLNLIIGAITPPVGTVLFVSAKVGGVKVSDVIAKQLPFLCVYLVAMVLFLLFPQLYFVPLNWLT